jgi:hypothetical protein
MQFRYTRSTTALRLTNMCSLSHSASGIVSNPDISGLDNSTYKLQPATLLKFESHYVQQASVHL